jgi:Ca-activated chloride channel family protein
MKRSNVNTSVVALVALGVLATGCSGGDDDSAASESSPLDEQLGLDQEQRFDDEPRSDVEDPSSPRVEGDDRLESGDQGADAEAPPATGAPSATLPAEGADSTPGRDRDRADAEGGLFSPEPTPPDSADDARFEDNTFRDYGYRDFVDARQDPLSTFALDVDTGSYSVMRRWLDEGALPPIESVRPEEYINAFHYDYRAPRRGLDVTIDGGPSPFDADNYLVRVGVQGEVVDDADRGPAALTFVVDTSGSMDRDDRLGLVKRSLGILVDELEDDDTVAIVTYDDDAGIVLQPTEVRHRDEILDAIDDLRPGGSTNLEAGLRTGYALAGEAFRSGGINRVVLASDGVANVGLVDPTLLSQMISEDAERGIDLVTVGFGMGNYNDVTMEQLADQGDGFYAYVDTDDEAERLFEDQLTATLLTIAKNAKIQVEFDSDVVAAYRLIGFENRGVHDSDFRNDTVDAGELGAGHQVTAIYEVELPNDLDIDGGGDLGEVFLRWEDPDSGAVEEIADEIRLGDIEDDWADTPLDFQLATVVATFAEVMRDNPHADRIDIDDLSDEADHLADALDDRDVDDLAALIEHAAQLR